MHIKCQLVIRAFGHDPAKLRRFMMTKCHPKTAEAASFVRPRLPTMLAAMEARVPEAHLHRRGYYQVRPGDIISRTDLFLLDVRFAPEDLDGEAGHIHQTHYLPLAELDRFVHPFDTPVVLICGNGRESVRAAERLAAKGYTEVYHLVGGMLRWNGEERPVARAGSWSHYKP